MRWHLTVLAVALAGFGVGRSGLAPAEEKPAAGKSALETDPTGWEDLLAGKGLKAWRRVGLPPDDKLNAKNAWSLSPDGKTLFCDGDGVKEMLLHETERGDGIFHIEWRFREEPGKTGYNSGVYVRSSPDGKVWHQAQVAYQDKPPLVGDLFGQTLVNGKPEMFRVEGTGSKRAPQPGAWNTFEVICKGKDVKVWVNGAVATAWGDCQVPRDRVGVQAEFFPIEFRNLKFKDLK